VALAALAIPASSDEHTTALMSYDWTAKDYQEVHLVEEYDARFNATNLKAAT
jgi:hypothetical protein